MMNFMKPLVLVLGGLILAGCMNAGNVTPQEIQYLERVNSKPTLSIKCNGGCKFDELSYTDPRDRKGLPQRTNGYDVINNIVNKTAGVATTAAPWIGVTRLGLEGIKAAGDVITDSNNTTTHNDSTHAPTIVEKDVVQVQTQVVEPTVIEQQVVNPVVINSETN